jgi:Ca2+-binding RTX toxin-like protein
LKVDGGAAAETLTVTNSHTSATVDMSGVASNITATAGAGTQTYKTGSGGDTFTNATGAKTVELGAGNDTFLTTVALITKLDSTIAGDGTDTLKLSTIDTIAATAFASVSGFERLAMDQTNLGGDKTFDMANLSDSFSRVSIGATNDKVVTLDNVDASMNDLRFTKTFAAAAVTTAEAVFDRLTDTTADAVSLNLASGNTIKTLSLLDEETITITVSGAAATGTITTLNVSDVTSMVLSGANTLVITTLAGESKLASIDASGATVAATINAADSMVNMTVTGNANSSGALAITTGAGTDTITGSYTGDTLSGGIGNDTISGLSGADTIDGDGGNDTLTGGGAADTFRIAEGTDTITDFSIAGGDKLSIDVSGVEARAQDGTAIDWVQVDKTAASVGNTDVLKGSLITGAIDLNTLTGNENMLVLNGTVATSALGTVIGTGGTFAVTHETTIADNDGFLVLHTDGTNAYLQLVSLDGTAVTNGNVMAPAVIGTNLITTLTGVTDLSGWTTANEVASVA